METELIILILLVVSVVVSAIVFLGYKYFGTKDKFNNIKKKDDIKQESLENKEKVLQYFGGDYCPFSNTSSNAYKVVKDFEDRYGNDVKVSYYWVGKDDEYMKKLNVQYVPTILNGDNKLVELKLSEDIDTKNLSNEELKDMLLENIYNNL